MRNVLAATVFFPCHEGGLTVAPTRAKFAAAQLQAFKAGNTYVNLHSKQHNGGEVRGQLEP